VRLLAAGMTLGLAGFWAASRLLRGALTGVPQAPVTAVVAAAAVIAVVCVSACLVPARRAARISPIDALARDSG